MTMAHETKTRYEEIKASIREANPEVIDDRIWELIGIIDSQELEAKRGLEGAISSMAESERNGTAEWERANKAEARVKELEQRVNELASCRGHT